MITFNRLNKATIIALVAVSLPCSLMAKPTKPIVVSINDTPSGHAVVQVQGAPHGYAIYTGPEVVDPTIEEGAAVVLYDVDLLGLVPEWGGRFTIPDAPLWYRSSVDIVWVAHDPGVIQFGALFVAFDSALPGHYYYNPDIVGDEDLGPLTDNWVTVYCTDLLVIRYKPHTYILK
jgi:hypothetical protein